MYGTTTTTTTTTYFVYPKRVTRSLMKLIKSEMFFYKKINGILCFFILHIFCIVMIRVKYIHVHHYQKLYTRVEYI